MAYLEDIFLTYLFLFYQEWHRFLSDSPQKLSLSFVKNRQSHLICSLTSLDTELYFCVSTHKEWFLCLPLKDSSDRASRFLFISPSAEQSLMINNVWWPFNVPLNNLIHSFILPSRLHTIKTFLSSKIHFLERYVLLSEIVWHKITMDSKWFLYTVSISLSKNSVLPHAVTPTNIAEWGNFGGFIYLYLIDYI